MLYHSTQLFGETPVLKDLGKRTDLFLHYRKYCLLQMGKFSLFFFDFDFD